MRIAETLGDGLYKPTTLCIFGNSPAILLGQPARQTPHIDVLASGFISCLSGLNKSAVGRRAGVPKNRRTDFRRIARQGANLCQPDRHGSFYDAGDLSRACSKIGILYDPDGEIDPDSIYSQHYDRMEKSDAPLFPDRYQFMIANVSNQIIIKICPILTPLGVAWGEGHLMVTPGLDPSAPMKRPTGEAKAYYTG